MIDFFTLIDKIKKRPALYLGRRSLSHLCTFLDGYTFALRQQDIPVSTEERIFEGFQEWIEEKFDRASTQHWSRIILFSSEDERDALETFFELFDEFIQENSEETTKFREYNDKMPPKPRPMPLATEAGYRAFLESRRSTQNNQSINSIDNP
ncbi:hypothetical protein V0288_18745 [Pannus brasiliensis CCIBt3594]|uniref:Uncharacterized protein n=1 Tax=Pannus brasiliensis CCIBt3594 TaxID=1427578 RepID=A0AAW9QN07_9CHRO